MGMAPDRRVKKKEGGGGEGRGIGLCPPPVEKSWLRHWFHHKSWTCNSYRLLKCYIFNISNKFIVILTFCILLVLLLHILKSKRK